MDELLIEFKDETQKLLSDLEQTLQDLESDPSKSTGYEYFGQIIDRIMGGAKSLAVAIPQNANGLQTIGDIAEICKAISYKMSQTKNPELGKVVVAFFYDAIDSIQEQLESLLSKSKSASSVKFLERAKWLDAKFDPNLRSSVSATGKSGGKT
jgi:hypothetical protein